MATNRLPEVSLVTLDRHPDHGRISHAFSPHRGDLGCSESADRLVVARKQAVVSAIEQRLRQGLRDLLIDHIKTGSSGLRPCALGVFDFKFGESLLQRVCCRFPFNLSFLNFQLAKDTFNLSPDRSRLGSSGPELTV
jgi:hypothetical protein